MATPFRGLRFTVFITAIQMLASLLFIAYLMDIGHQFLATTIVLFYIIAMWRHPHIITAGHPSAIYFILFLGGLLGYAILLLVGAMMGATNLFMGPHPIVLPLFASLFSIVAMLYHGLATSSVGASIGTRGVVAIVLVVSLPIVYFGGQFLLGGSWGNAGGLIGEAGYGVGQAFGTVTEPIGNQLEYIQNRVLNPSRNRNLAQLVCAGQLLSGGGVFEVASGSASMSQCVEEMLGGNESQARSEQVTDPLEVQMGDIQVEPFSDHVRVSVPVTNTLVQDLEGVPIEMPARDVAMRVEWRYLDTVVATAEQTAGTIPNGDTRQFDFESRDSGSPYFATFPVINGDYTDSSLRTRLAQVRDGEESPDWFINRFENGQLSRERVAFIIRSTDELSCDDPAGMGPVCDDLHEHVGEPLPPVILQGREYSIDVYMEYKYNAEAAFTQSSRWRSGNQLLEVWTEEAWQDLPFEERQQWRSTKCGEVEKYGQTFTKQRTAALTTPVVPVMYTDCGISLFRNIVQGEESSIDIEIGVNVNEESDAVSHLPDSEAFRITAAETTCLPGAEETSILAGERNDGRPGITTDWFGTAEGIDGWTSGGSQDTTIITRAVTVEGERQSIACRTTMNITLNVQDGTTYEVPQIG